MKRLLICLVPWMAMTVAAQQEAPRQAEVVYTNVGPAAAWRIGDECYIAPGVLTSWHWPFTIVDSEAMIQAEGRTLKIPTKIVHDRILIPVTALFDQLGAVCQWRPNDELQILGQVRMVSVGDGKLQIDSTLSSKPHVFTLTDPSRLVIDMRGMVIAPRVGSQLPSNVHASQYGPDTVRVVFESPDVPRLPTDTQDATRHFTFPVQFAPRTYVKPGKADLVQHDDPISEEPAAQTPTNSARVVPQMGTANPSGATVDPIKVSGENSRVLTLLTNVNGSLSAPVRMKRIDPFTFDITLPGAKLSRTDDKQDSSALEELNSHETSEGVVIHVRTTRPMGVELSTPGNQVQITLQKPTGNGSLQGKVVVIDAGHGGTDSGARSPDHYVNEKDLTLAIAQEVAANLASQGATVIMTRKTDVFIPLKERPAIANRNNADFFVSVHINSNTINDSKSGTTTYYHGHDPSSEMLAQCVEHEIGKVSGLPAIGVASDTSRYKTGFAVLRYSHMPAILVETGYINCTADRTKMCGVGFQAAVAKAIVHGIKVYLGDAKQDTTQ